MTHLYKKKLINDPIHGMIEVPAYAQSVIATPLFQRLGRVKQLGCLEKVWPSAVHTRLEHSIGTMHLAIVYARLLGFKEYETKVFVLACLLHDIAHGPFSHTFERAIEGTTSGEIFRNHDHFRVRLLAEDAGLKASIPSDIRLDILAVWEGRSSCSEMNPCEIKAMHTLLAGPAGVDRMDYILRDSYHTTPQRRLDATCIQSIMHHTAIGLGGLILYSEKGARYVGHLLAERAYLYREVYTHRKAQAAESLLLEAFETGLEEEVRPFIMYSPERFEALDDAFVTSRTFTEDYKPYWEPLLKFVRSDLPKDFQSSYCLAATEKYSGTSDIACITRDGEIVPLQNYIDLCF